MSKRMVPLLIALALTGLIAGACAKQPMEKAGVLAPAPPVSTPASAPPPPAPPPEARPLVPPAPAPPPPAIMPAPAPREFADVPQLRDIHFDFDKYEIRPGDAKILDDNAKWMKANPNRLILIEGHADERGTNEYNLALGDRRAKTAMTHLVSLGVQVNRVTTISYGEERPTCTEQQEECWSKNRRAHFLVKPR